MAHSEEFNQTANNKNQAVWVTAEYEAGYVARLQGTAEFTTATPSWRTGC